MTNQRQKCIAIKSILFAALLLFGGAAWAQVVGTIAHLSGPLVAKKANGSVKVLSVKSEVENGDTLVAEKNTYAQIKFIDNGEITLRPNTTFRIEKFAYDADKAEGDVASFDLVKGGLRSVTGLLGKRNKEKFALKTPSATIGIRGTTFIAQYVPPDAPGVSQVPLPTGGTGSGLGKSTIDRSPAGDGSGAGSGGKVAASGAGSLLPMPPSGPAAPPLSPGLHLSVTDGAIVVSNAGGSLGFTAGQFGFVPGINTPPVLVPSNPGLHFAPPPTFGIANGGPVASSGPAQNSAAVDCIVR
jgi:hypothetical protein